MSWKLRETLGDLCRSDSRLFLVATYTDRKMCWSTSLYSSSTNHHLYRVQLFSDTKHETENSVGEKEKPLSFWKGKFVGRGTLDRPPLIWRRTLSTCTETSALPRENFLLFFSLPILGMSPYRWFTSDVLCSSYGQDDL